MTEFIDRWEAFVVDDPLVRAATSRVTKFVQEMQGNQSFAGNYVRCTKGPTHIVDVIADVCAIVGTDLMDITRAQLEEEAEKAYGYAWDDDYGITNKEMKTYERQRVAAVREAVRAGNVVRPPMLLSGEHMTERRIPQMESLLADALEGASTLAEAGWFDDRIKARVALARTHLEEAKVAQIRWRAFSQSFLVDRTVKWDAATVFDEYMVHGPESKSKSV